MSKTKFANLIDLPFIKSCAAKLYSSSVGNCCGGELTLDIKLEEPIKTFRQYRISCIEDETLDGLATIGISLLNNILGSASNTKIDYPDHWFLIAVTKSDKYYLIEKGENGKNISYFDDIHEAKNYVMDNYYNNRIELMDIYKLNEDINIKDVFDYVKTLSNDYNLIDNNCQTFVRNILNHYNCEVV